MAQVDQVAVLGRDFYTDPFWKELYDDTRVYLRDEPIAAKYYNPGTQETQNYTEKDVLDGGGIQGNFVSESRIAAKDGTLDVQLMALPDSDNYARLTVLQALLNNPDLMAQAEATGKITREEIEADFQIGGGEEIYRRYKNILNMERPEISGLGTEEEYKRRDDPEAITSPAVQTMSPGVMLLETGREFFHDLNEDQRAQLQLRGIKPRYLENYYRIPFRQKSDSLEFNKRTAQTPNHPTGSEYLNVIKPFDPVRYSERFGDTYPKVTQINPKDPVDGLIIQSIYNPIDEETGKPAWLPVEQVQPVESALDGNLEPFLNEMEKFAAQEGLPIAGGLGIMGLITKFTRSRIKKRLKRTAEDLREGKAPSDEQFGIFGKMFPRGSKRETALEIGLTSLGYASTEAATKFAMIASGTVGDDPTQPDLQFNRALRDSGALFQSALMYGAAGDAFLRTMGYVWGRMTGRVPSNNLMDQMIVEARVLGGRIRGIQADSPDALPEDLDAGQRERIRELLNDPEFNPPETKLGGTVKEQKQLVDESSRKVIELLKGRYQTLGQLSQNDVMQAMEEVLALDLGPASTYGSRFENIAAENSAVLDDFYNAIVRQTGADPVLKDAFPETFSKANVNEIFRGIRGQQLLDDLSAEELKILDAQATANIKNLIPPAAREQRATDAAIVQEQVSTAQSKLFPDSKSRLLIMKQNEIKDAYSEIENVLNESAYTDPANAIKLPFYIKAELNDFLNANKESGSVFSTLDADEASQVIRDMLPMRDDEGISIKALLGIAQKEGGGFATQRAFTPAEVIRTRQNLQSVVNGHPNPIVREKGENLVKAFDRAIDAQHKKMYTNLTGDKKAPDNMDEVYDLIGLDYQQAALGLKQTQQELSSRYLLDIVKRPENEIGQFIRTSNPDQVRALVNLLSRQEGGLEKLESVKQLVLDSISREVRNPFAAEGSEILRRGDQAKKFEKILQNNEEQLRALFPEDFVTFTNFPSLMDTASKAIKESKVNIRALQKELEKLADPETGEVPAITDVLDRFFGMSSTTARAFDQTTAQQSLKEISKLADKFPELRSAMKQYFGEEILIKQLQTPFYRAAKPGQRMRRAADVESPFNFNNLRRMFLDPYNTDRELANNLELIVGKEDALRYAKDLRILARQINKQSGFSGSPISRYARQVAGDVTEPGRKGGYAETVRQVRKLIFGPLDLTSTRIGTSQEILLNKLDKRKLEFLAKIVLEPERLRAYLKAEQLKLPAINMLKLMGTIAYGRIENVGGAANEDEAVAQAFRDRLSTLTEESRGFLETSKRYLEEAFYD